MTNSIPGSDSESPIPTRKWSKRITKWKNGIDLNKSTKDDITEYIQTKLYYYVVDRVQDDDLWELFQIDFSHFDAELFKEHHRELQNIRRMLRCGGVYVAPNTKNVTMAQRLVEVLEEEEQHEWTQQDLEEADKDLSKGPITSALIKLGTNGFTHRTLLLAIAKNASTYNETQPKTSVTTAPEIRYTPAPENQYTPAPEIRYIPAPENRHTPAPENRYTPAPETRYTPVPENRYTPAPETRYTPVPENRYMPALENRNTQAPENRYMPTTEAIQVQTQYIPTIQPLKAIAEVAKIYTNQQ